MVVLNYKVRDELSGLKEVIDYPRNGRRESHGDGENWWVCVFNPEIQYPAVIDNVEVTQKVKFLGLDPDDDNVFHWLQDYPLTWQFINGRQALSIPASPQKLWQAFHRISTENENSQDEGLFFPEDGQYPGLGTRPLSGSKTASTK